MCGIAGIIDQRENRPIDRAALQRMTDALTHRGPDGEGFFVENGIGFGHRRLAIIDRVGGAQPFHAVDGGVLCYNGEIYNLPELASALKSSGHIFRTRSDTEVLCEMVSRHGLSALLQLHGMFAFAFWRPQTRELLLARDRLGEKPLFYCETPDGFLLFASEIQAIAASGMTPLDIEPTAIADYFQYGYIPDPKTIYRSVYKLPPGCTLSLKPGTPLRIDRYWRPRFDPDTSLTFDDAADMLRHRLDEAVGRQMMSDMPIGAFLSGGIDSAGVVMSMAQNGGAPTTCTIGFRFAAYDERAPAREIASKVHADHHEHLAEIDAVELIDHIAKSYGEPFADPSALPTFLVCKIARQHVSVALTGDGGDELFAGYRRYGFHLAEERMRSLAPQSLRRLILGPAGRFYPKLDWGPRPLRWKTTLQSLSNTTTDGYALSVAASLPARIKRIYSADFLETIDAYDPADIIKTAIQSAETDDPLAAAQYADFQTWLPGRMLTKIDRASMANSLEARPPMLDAAFVDWATQLPSAFKHKNGAGKRILKTALEPRLGAGFVHKKKRGFSLPLADWIRGDKNRLAGRLEASQRWRESGLFDEAAVSRLMHDHQRGASDNSQEIWSLIMFDAFLDTARAS
ncbi:MAG: asparagine synthase (glutamine-hydrolyzing) [Pseudomonadota bacterium]